MEWIKEPAPSAYQRYWFTAKETNAKGEALVIEATECRHNLKDKKCLMNLWAKNGFIKEPLESYWSISTYVTDTEGNCRLAYNPSCYFYTQRDSKGKVIISNTRIDFDWLLTATEENLQKMLAECARMFLAMEPMRQVEEVTA